MVHVFTQIIQIGIVLIILEILYTLTYAFCRKHIDKLILVMMAITVIATIVPGINAVDFSKIMQKRVITRFIESGMPDSIERGSKTYYLHTDMANPMTANYTYKP